MSRVCQRKTTGTERRSMGGRTEMNACPTNTKGVAMVAVWYGRSAVNTLN